MVKEVSQRLLFHSISFLKDPSAKRNAKGLQARSKTAPPAVRARKQKETEVL